MTNRTFPTAVDPVNDILATSGCSQITLPTADAFSRELVNTFSTPAGIPAFSANYKPATHSIQTD